MEFLTTMWELVLRYTAPLRKSLGWLVEPSDAVRDFAIRKRARLSASMALVLLIFNSIGLPFVKNPVAKYALIGLTVSLLVAYILSRSPWYRLGGMALVISLSALAYLPVLTQSALTADAFSKYFFTFAPMSLVIAFGLLGSWEALSTAVINIVLVVLVSVSGVAPEYTFSRASSDGGLLATICFLLLVVENTQKATERERLAQIQEINVELQEANKEINLARESLAASVAERTAELEKRTEELSNRSQELEVVNLANQRRAAQFQAVSLVSSSIASVRNLNELLPQITKVISERFGFYHAGIFLADESNKFAVLSAANSKGGQQMLKRGHRLEIGQVGIVGYVMGTGMPRVALDTGADPVHFKNPDLPDTHSEMALPLRAGDEIIGALDVQSTEVNAFSKEDIEVLSTLADQVSIAIQNARLFEATQKSLAEVEAMYRQYLRKEWSQVVDKQKIAGYRYNLLGIAPLDHVDNTKIEQVASAGEVYIDQNEEASVLAIPITLRGETIGILDVKAPQGRTWKQDEIDIAQAVADRVAISAENARLFDETTTRAERERMVTEITSKIRSTNDPAEMIQIALNELRQVLNVKEARVLPYKDKASQKQ